jgi:hypothetical protein
MKNENLTAKNEADNSLKKPPFSAKISALLEKIKKFLSQNKKQSYTILALVFLNAGIFIYFTGKFPLAIFMPSFRSYEPRPNITLYLPNSNLTQFVKDERAIYPYKNNALKIEGIIEELAARPILDNTKRAIPSGIRLRRVWIYDKIAFLDFSKSIRKVKIANPDIEKFFVYGITRSIMQNISEIKGVKFLIEGREIDILWGGVDLRTPITFNEG